MIQIIFLLLSIFFLVGGIVGSIVNDNWLVLPLILILIALSLLIASGYLFAKKNRLWQKRSIRQNTNVLITTIVVLAIFGLINTVGVRYNQRWDLTENQRHTLSSYSQAVIAKLEQPLTLSIFDRDISPKVKNLLSKYHRANHQFQFKLINPEQELGLRQQYGVQSLGEVFLEYGEKKHKLNLGNSSTKTDITETILTNSIENIQRDRFANIYLLQGHGEAPNQLVERGIAQLIQTLEQRGNTVKELNLASNGEIPDNTNLIIIAGAVRKLLTQEVSGLHTYLSTGGNLLLLLSPNTDIGIDPLLAEWGIKLDHRLVIDSSGAGRVMGFGPGVAIVNNYGDHPITASFGNGTSIFPESRPLTTIPKIGIASTPLVITNEKAWAESDLKKEEITFDSAQDISGPLYIAIALENEKLPSSRLVVFGSATFATNGWLEQQLNLDLILNSVNWLTSEEDKILAIQPRETANRRIILSLGQAKIIHWLALKIIPILGLSIAIILWHQHR